MHNYFLQNNVEIDLINNNLSEKQKCYWTSIKIKYIYIVLIILTKINLYFKFIRNIKTQLSCIQLSSTSSTSILNTSQVIIITKI